MESTQQNKGRRSMRIGLQRSTKSKVERIGKISRCPKCEFTSNRRFNVIRHYGRIHEAAKRELRCCGEEFSTKCQLYQHCVDVHPESRRSTIASLTKYGISSAVLRNRKTARRRSLRNAIKPERKVKKEKVKDEPKEEPDFDEDVPLIYYFRNRKLKKNRKEELNIKLEDDCGADNRIEIFFKGDATSPIHSQIQKQFLSDIDFDIFKIL